MGKRKSKSEMLKLSFSALFVNIWAQLPCLLGPGSLIIVESDSCYDHYQSFSGAQHC